MNPPRISMLRAAQVRVPLESPVWLGAAQVSHREYCVLQIESEEGYAGTSLAFTRGADIAGVLLGPVWQVVKGTPALEPEAVFEKMQMQSRVHGDSGIYQRAVSLVDLALWDLKARAFGCPLHALLGGYRNEIPVMMAGGYYGEGKGLEALCEEFARYESEGFARLKLIVGGASMEEDFQRFVAVRKVLNAGTSLGVDANGAWKDRRAVLGWLHRLQAEGVMPEFVEEPLPPHDIAGLSWLAERSHSPIAVGEFLSGRDAFLELLQKNAVDILRADMTLCGGVTEWKAIAALAGAWSKPLMPHYFASLHLHGALALPGSHCVEVVSTVGRNSSFHLLAGTSFELRDGTARSKQKPGLGLEIDEEFLQAHTVSKGEVRL